MTGERRAPKKHLAELMDSCFLMGKALTLILPNAFSDEVLKLWEVSEVPCQNFLRLRSG